MSETWYHRKFKILQFIPTSEYVAVYADEAEDGLYDLWTTQCDGLVVVEVTEVFHECSGRDQHRFPLNHKTRIENVTNEICGVVFGECGLEVCDEVSNFCGLIKSGETPKPDCLYSMSPQIRDKLRETKGVDDEG